MDILIEDLVRIIIFIAIVIWYIYSLVSRAKKSKEEEKARLQKPSNSVNNNVKAKSSSTYGASKPPSMEDMFGDIFGAGKEESFWDKAQEEQAQAKSSYHYEDEEERREKAFETSKPKLKKDILKDKYSLYNKTIKEPQTKIESNIKTTPRKARKSYASLHSHSLKFSDNTIVQGFIFSEVISKPKGIE